MFASFVEAIAQKNGRSLRSIVRVVDGVIPEVTPQGLATINPRWIQFFKAWIESVMHVQHGNSIEAFEAGLQLLKVTNKIALNESCWILPVLQGVASDLRVLAKRADSAVKGSKNAQNAANNVQNTPSPEESYTEQAARAVSDAFKTCLNDREENIAASKSRAVYFFVAMLYSMYFSLGKTDLAKAVAEAFRFKLAEMPSLSSVPRAESAAYLYYSGRLCTKDGDFERALEHLEDALQICGSARSKGHVLVAMVPLMFLVKRKLPCAALYEQYPQLSVYKALFDAAVKGNIGEYRSRVADSETFLLKMNVYLVFVQIKMLIVQRVFKTAAHVTASLPSRFPKAPTQVPISAFAIALSLAGGSGGRTDDKTTECYLANLIYEGFMKGYISNIHGVVVLSKNNQFPALVR